VEFILIAPFLLLVLLLVYNTGLLMHVKAEQAVTVRRATWSAALYRHLPAGLSRVACFTAEPDREFGGNYLFVCGEDDATGDFRTGMERAGGGVVAGVTDVIRRDTPPYLAAANSFVDFRAWGGWMGDDFGTVFWRNRHALSANQSWELGDLPVGYNEYLRRELRSADTIFPSVFEED
jgi:hypothetical protein